MIIKTNLRKLENLLDRDATIIFRNKAKEYIHNSVKNPNFKNWDEYLINKHGLNLKQSCFQVINSITVSTLDNLIIINIDKEWEDIYRALKFGTLTIMKTPLLENAFKYALRRL